MTSPDGPAVLVTIQKPLFEKVSTPDARDRLRAMAGRLVLNDTDDPWAGDEVRERVGRAGAVLNSWGSCSFDENLLEAAPELRIICYAAGSIRRIAPPAVFERGIKVTHAAHVIADSVAEFTLGVVLGTLRQAYQLDGSLRAGNWKDASGPNPRELYGKTYGIVGASMVGRKLIPLLKPFDVEILVYDPFLSASEAKELGCRKVSLADLMSGSDVISLHAPILPETRRMIDGPLLSSIKDDAIFINNARSWLVDSDALLEELRKERFDAALDVFDDEPLPPNDPLLGLKRTLLTPHVAGFSAESRARLVGAMLDELERFMAGKPLEHEVTLGQLKSMA